MQNVPDVPTNHEVSERHPPRLVSLAAPTSSAPMSPAAAATSPLPPALQDTRHPSQPATVLHQQGGQDSAQDSAQDCQADGQGDGNGAYHARLKAAARILAAGALRAAGAVHALGPKVHTPQSGQKSGQSLESGPSAAASKPVPNPAPNLVGSLVVPLVSPLVGPPLGYGLDCV